MRESTFQEETTLKCNIMQTNQMQCARKVAMVDPDIRNGSINGEYPVGYCLYHYNILAQKEAQNENIPNIPQSEQKS
jgi:hypothetical protein